MIKEYQVQSVVCVGSGMQLLLEGVEQCKGIFMIVGDHGNCDDMAQRTEDGTPIMDASGCKALPKTCHSIDEVCNIDGF